MKAPALQAVMQRRILVNFRVAPDVLAGQLPPPFRPALVGGVGIAGICLIRLGNLRPAGIPASFGLTSENAAHRIAVEWDGPNGPATGVYIPRRDTTSRLAALGGGRLFPGQQHRARFRVHEAAGQYRIEIASYDRNTRITVAAHEAATVTSGSVFADTEAASEFFRAAPVGYTPTPNYCTFDGVELGTQEWHLRPLHLQTVQSSYFDDPNRFPPGTTAPDSAFLMTGLAITWQPGPVLTVTA